jgi:hypothetical protein
LARTDKAQEQERRLRGSVAEQAPRHVGYQ